jgi:Rieske Fe-S protein
MSEDAISRRSVIGSLAVAVAAGAAGFAVARSSPLSKRATAPTGGNGYGSGPPATSGGQPLAEVAQVPEGGGLILAKDAVVLSRTTAGAVHGLSAICTHEGCTVGSVANGVITCPCHGSRFNAFTGAVVNGPATRPLPAVAVVVRNGAIYRD